MRPRSQSRRAAAGRPPLLALIAICMGWAPHAPADARADLRQAVNEARVQGCHAAPLREAAALVSAVARVAEGQSLHTALTAAGYLASQSTVLHLSGSVGDAQVRHALESRYCSALSDPHWSDFAVLRRGREVWVLLAAPVVLPGSQEAAQFDRQVLLLVNAARARARRCGAKAFGPAAPLVLRTALNRAAQAHSDDMAAYGEFDHRGHDRSTPSVRVERAGYGAYSVVGENIAAGAMTPSEVTAGWLASPPHCENIMDPRFTDVGIAVAVNRRSPQLIYWTQDFAMPRAVPPGAAPPPSGAAAASRTPLNP